MVLRFLARFLLNNEQLINRLADSYMIRRAARVVAYFLNKGQAHMEKLKDSDAMEGIEHKVKSSAERLKQFPRRLSEELKEGVKEFKEEIKKKR